MTKRRSSSLKPLGSFHSAMSRVMLTSCGIQWLAQVARYFSHAHLYLKGTNWLTSVWPLMMRLSAAFTRRVLEAADVTETGVDSVGITGALAPSSNVRVATGTCAVCEMGEGGISIKRLVMPLAKGSGVEGFTSSSQVNINYFPILELSMLCTQTQSVARMQSEFVLCKYKYASVLITDKLRRLDRQRRKTSRRWQPSRLTVVLAQPWQPLRVRSTHLLASPQTPSCVSQLVP